MEIEPETPAAENEIALKTEGQRHINLMWETTQMRIALSVVWMSLAVASMLATFGEPDVKTAAFVFLFGAANLVIGFYFGRTNHQREGGIGSHDAGR